MTERNRRRIRGFPGGKAHRRHPARNPVTLEARRTRALRRYLGRFGGPEIRLVNIVAIFLALICIEMFALGEGSVGFTIFGLAFSLLMGLLTIRAHYQAHSFIRSARASGELGGILDDFAASIPILKGYIRVGTTWIFGRGTGSPVRTSEITGLYLGYFKIADSGKCLNVKLRDSDAERMLGLLPKNASQDELGYLAMWVSQSCPKAEVLVGESSSPSETPLGGRVGAGGPAPLATGVWGTCPWDINNLGVLTVWPGEAENCPNASPWDAHKSQVVTVVFKPGVKLPSLCRNLFCGFSSLKMANTYGWDTSGVTDMSRMFSGCSSLSSLEVYDWDTSQVTTMMSLFDGCVTLEGINPSRWDTSSVRDMAALFFGCSSLRSLDLSRWSTASLEDVRYAFAGCARLEDLNISGWKIPYGEESRGMLDGCPARRPSREGS